MLLLFLIACGDKTTAEPEPDTAADDLPARTFLIAPFLQSTTASATAILWMTDDGEESRVSFGLTDGLGLTATGTAETEGGTGIMHSVSLTGLPPDSDVYYQVHTDGSTSPIQRFHTPPESGEAAEFLIVAMSDMQRDDSHPEMFAELVSDGVLPYIADEYGGEPADHVGMVLIPGDLVDSGWLYTDWLDDFFAGAAPLIGQSTLWPVPGNHESNSPLFFRYFQLPENGTPGYEEHWWWADYGRVRVFGLDSNGAYGATTQLEWLETELAATCTDDGVDMVIAQLHHPYLSEVWVPGELDFTGEVIARLESFTTDCGRPSVHLFGHTHAYSRGQSRDHRHLWVNVASAGGALDRWGGSEQADYEQFTVSQDEYGFVVLDVDAEGLGLTRISRGTPEEPLDNVVRDSLRIPLTPTPPATPVATSSTVGEVIVLTGSAFSDDGAHGASHWEVAQDCADFTEPLVSEWVQHQNEFGGADTQEGDDLTDVALSPLPAGSYCWRVRYRDQGLSWSDWSDSAELVVP
jgi:acid phosphatase type 7